MVRRRNNGKRSLAPRSSTILIKLDYLIFVILITAGCSAFPDGIEFRMFFLRPAYKYGDPAEKPEPVDADKWHYLRDWILEVEDLFNDAYKDARYPGPHRYLYLTAVYYDLHQQCGGNSAHLTREKIVMALNNNKNWPTRGSLQKTFDGRLYEDRGNEPLRDI